MKKNTIIILLFISHICSAQFFGNYIENRFSSGKDGNYIFLLDEKFMAQNDGLIPELYKKNPYFLIERSEDQSNFEVIDTLRAVQSVKEFEDIYGEGIFQQLKNDTSYLHSLSESEIIKLFENPNEKALAPLYFIEPIKQLRAAGICYLDAKAKPGVTYFYRIKNAVGKINARGKVLTGKPNEMLKGIRLRFNQASIAAIDSALVGSWFQLKQKHNMAFTVNYFGKKTHEKDYQLIHTQKITYKQDTLEVLINHRTKGKEVWDVFVVPVDMLGNEGTPSDTATLASFSKSNLTFPKDFIAKDSSNGIYLSWQPVLDHSYVAGYLISREFDSKTYKLLDTIPANKTYYIDYNVENGIKYNYELQVLPAPISNFKWRDFPSVRAAGVHTANERILPPKNIQLNVEDKYVKISWEKVNNSEILAYYVFSSLTGKPDDFKLVGTVEGNDFYIDTTNHGDFQHLQRYYAVKSMGYNLKFSQLSNVKAIQPYFEIIPIAPAGLTIQNWGDNYRLSWTPNILNNNSIKQFNVYRKAAGDSIFLKIDSSVTQNEYFDTTATNDLQYEYAVSVTSISDHESALSISQKSNPKQEYSIIKKPKGIGNVKGTNIPPGIQISWMLSRDSTVAKVKIFRIIVYTDETEYQLIGEADANLQRYWDREVVLNKTYAYTIATIDKDGNESQKDFLTVVKRIETEE